MLGNLAFRKTQSDAGNFTAACTCQESCDQIQLHAILCCTCLSDGCLDISEMQKLAGSLHPVASVFPAANTLHQRLAMQDPHSQSDWPTLR